jgi:hypothetical protein
MNEKKLSKVQEENEYVLTISEFGLSLTQPDDLFHKSSFESLSWEHSVHCVPLRFSPGFAHGTATHCWSGKINHHSIGYAFNDILFDIENGTLPVKSDCVPYQLYLTFFPILAPWVTANEVASFDCNVHFKESGLRDHASNLIPTQIIWTVSRA